MLTIIHPLTGKLHTLFPHNGWGDGSEISWKRRRKTNIATGIKGNENRDAKWDLGREEITCLIIAESLQEHGRLVARLDQASKSGFGCAPFFGKSTVLSITANAGGNALTFDANPLWTWQLGDFVILLGPDDETFDCIAVDAVAGNILTLAGNLQFKWNAGTKAWPLLFGKFSMQEEQIDNAEIGEIKITITENESARSAQLGALPAAAPGVGEQVVGSTNQL